MRRSSDYYDIHGRPRGLSSQLHPAEVAYYDGVVEIDLSTIEPMIAMPFHPSNAYTIDELNANADGHPARGRGRAPASRSTTRCHDDLWHDKIHDGQSEVDQGVIAGCAGGTFENIMRGCRHPAGQEHAATVRFTLSVYPASTPSSWPTDQERRARPT